MRYIKYYSIWVTHSHINLLGSRHLYIIVKTVQDYEYTLCMSVWLYVQSDYRPLVHKVLDVFKPNKFAVTLISNEVFFLLFCRLLANNWYPLLLINFNSRENCLHVVYRTRFRRVFILICCSDAAANSRMASIATTCSTHCSKTSTTWRTRHSRNRSVRCWQPTLWPHRLHFCLTHH